MSQPARWPGPQMKWIPMCSWHRTLVIHFSGWNGKKMSLIHVRSWGTNETLLLRNWVHVCFGGFCLLSRGWIQGDRWYPHNFSPGSFELRWFTVIQKKVALSETEWKNEWRLLLLAVCWFCLSVTVLWFCCSFCIQFMRPNARVRRMFGSFAIKSLEFDAGTAATGQCYVFDESWFTI